MLVVNNLLVWLCYGSMLLAIGFAAEYDYTSFDKIVRCKAPNGLFTPNSVAEVVSIVKQAALSKQNVRVVTVNKWSITDVVCASPTNGLAVLLENFKDLTYEEDKNTITVGSGWQVQKLSQAIAEQYKVSLLHLASFGSITVGGAVATGAHGSSLKHSASLSDALVGVRVVQADGSVKNITDEATLRHYKVNLGALGIITHFTFPVVPLFKVQWTTTAYGEDVLTDGTLLEIARNSDGVYTYWNPHSKSVVAAVMKYVDAATPGNDYWNYIPDVNAALRTAQKSEYETLQATKLNETFCDAEDLLHARLTSNEGLYQLIAPYFEDAGTRQISGSKLGNGLTATGWSYNMLSSFCDDCPFSEPEAIYFNDFGIDTPINRFTDVIKFTQNILERLPVCFPLSDILIRFIKASDGDLISSSGEDYTSIEWDTIHRNDPWTDPELDMAWVSWVSQGYLLNFGGKSHWGKTGNFPHFANPVGIPRAIDLYPQLSAFMAYQRSVDPQGLFINDFYRSSILEEVQARATKVYPRCALVYDCVCQTDDHCAENQKCIPAPLPGGKTANICLDESQEAGLIGTFEALKDDFDRHI